MSPRSRRAAPRPGVRTRTIWLIGLGAVGVIAILIVAGAAVTRWQAAAFSHPPTVGTTIQVAPSSTAAEALDTVELTAEQRDATTWLAAQPTAVWLTPEADPIGAVGDTVTSLAADARDQDASLAIVVYGLPGRDCGQFSSGGLPPEDYPVWIDEIAAALTIASDIPRIVVLEPDSLALAPECGNVAERTAQLRSAASALAGPDVWIYLDGGHSNWLPAAEMAALLNGVDAGQWIRGFATNVSNYQDGHSEFRYAEEVSRLTGNLHAIVDTSRNGAATAGSEWCNPAGQRVGEPTGTFHTEVVDTNLWIKPPGESDGTCNGGPAAGEWWPDAAVELTRDVR